MYVQTESDRDWRTALGVLLEVSWSTFAQVLKAVGVVGRTHAVVVTTCVQSARTALGYCNQHTITHSA